MTFATVEVRCKPRLASLAFLTRPADACRVSIDWWTLGQAGKARKFPTMPGRWDSHAEPLRVVPSHEITFPPGFRDYGGTIATTGPGAPIITPSTRYQYDPDRVNPEQTIAVGSDLGRVSVAVLRGRDAFAFSDESYVFMDKGLAHPAWQLELGTTYLVDIHVKGSNAEAKATFKLEYLSDEEFRNFQLLEVQ